MKISVSMYRALCYADVFHFPLTLEEMKKYAIRRGKQVSEVEIKKRVAYFRGYYCFKGHELYVNIRIKNLSHVHKKMKFARFAARIFSFMPTVLGVFVTGGLAVGNVKPDDDIDFMIVTKQHWLWTTRFILVVMSKVLGKYTHKRIRREDATAADANTWCLNMWLDETALAIPLSNRNLYTAHEVIQALPLVNKERIAERFLWANRWVGKEMQIDSHCERAGYGKKRVAYFFETLFRLIQVKKNQKGVSKNTALFHPTMTGHKVMEEYGKRVRGERL